MKSTFNICFYAKKDKQKANGAYNLQAQLQHRQVHAVLQAYHHWFVKCCLGAFKGQIYFQYDYRHFDGELFSTVAKTLDECRRRRDEWVAKKNGVINK